MGRAAGLIDAEEYCNNFIRTYHLGEFQKLPSYQAFCRRLNRLAAAFAALAEVLFEQKLASSEPTHGYVLDPCPVMVSVGPRSNTAKTARNLCNLTRNPTKNLCVSRRQAARFCPTAPASSSPIPCAVQISKASLCHLWACKADSIWTAHRSQTAGSMQIVPRSTQNGSIPSANRAGTSRSSRRESGKSTMFLFPPKMPYPPASVPCGSRSRSFSTGCRPKRTSSLLRTVRSCAGLLFHIFSSPRFRRPPLAVQLLIRIIGEALAGAESQSLPFQGRWLGEAETERSYQILICGNLSVTFGDSIPTPFVPSGHFPLIGGIGPWKGSLSSQEGKIHPDFQSAFFYSTAIVLRQLAANLEPLYSGGAAAETRKVTTEWNARLKHWFLPKFRGRMHQARPSAPFLPYLFRQDGKDMAAAEGAVRNDHDGTSRRERRLLFSLCARFFLFQTAN